MSKIKRSSAEIGKSDETWHMSHTGSTWMITADINSTEQSPSSEALLVTQFTVSSEIQRFITVFTKAHHFSWYSDKCIQSTVCHSTSVSFILILSSHLYPVFLSDLPTKCVHAYLTSLPCATCTAYLIFCDLFIVKSLMQGTNNDAPLYASKLGAGRHMRFTLLWALKRLSWGHVQRYEGSFPSSSTSKCYLLTPVGSSPPGRTKLMHSLYHTSAWHHFVVKPGKK